MISQEQSVILINNNKEPLNIDNEKLGIEPIKKIFNVN